MEYLCVVLWQVPKAPKEETDGGSNNQEDVHKLAIGVPGGFRMEDDKDYSIEKEYCLCIKPIEVTLSITDERIPSEMKACIAAIKVRCRYPI